MNYREYPVPDALGRHLRCIWRLREPRPSGVVQTIYPDGCCELIMHLATPPFGWDASEGWRRQAETLYAGQRLCAVRLRATQSLDCLGLRLAPAASAAVAAQSLLHFGERIVNLAELDADFSQALGVAARGFAAGSKAPMLRLLASRIAAYPIDERIAAAVTRIEASAGRARMGVMARAAAMSMRGFQIRFRQRVGLRPKEFAQLLRLQALLRALDGGDESISALSAEQGFSDQAHATRELRRITGITPARLRSALRRDRNGEVTVRLAAAFVRGHFV